ncbi:acylphosphatase [Terrihabitans sp. B22-R8]|uniref:acylphosphatase n=1 Tax=Terrihabitans sp. B22-R8 TaxID=3425128 RepID=UPI00403C16FC
MESSVHIIVTGKVQGVGYRAWLQDQAKRRELHGWTRNRTDGSVEAVVAGPDRDVADLLAEIRIGPATARVDDMRTRPAAPAEATSQHGAGFLILPDL